jgi:hypothetical protein
MPRQGTAVFVSYSHADTSLVAPVVNLLRANKSFVFQDIDRIQPGKKWRSEISRALAEAQLVVVFWCDHASRSNEVSKEWKAAIEQEKDLLPLLLDGTPLPAELSEYQWIDFRGTVGSNHASIESKALEPAAPQKSGRWLPLAGLAAVAVTVVGMSLFVLLEQSVELSSPTPLPIDPAPPPSIVEDSAIGNTLLMLSVVLIAAAFAVWFFRRRSKHGKASVKVGTRYGEIERRIATELEAEMLRRTTSSQDAEA